MPDPRDRPLRGGKISIFRHPLWVRLTHWTNVLAVLVMLTSGMQIYNAHPALDWGQQSSFTQPWLHFGPFPSWLTLPPYQDLSHGRRWHLFFAWVFLINGLIYVVLNAISGERRRRLIPSREGLRHIWAHVKDHARLRFPKGEAARNYNVLQQLTYLFMVLIVLPGLILTGLTMSPGFNALVPQLLDLFGGRQSARTIHFLCASLLVGFVMVHVGLVFLAGFWNEIRSMVTGRYTIDPDDPPPMPAEPVPAEGEAA